MDENEERRWMRRALTLAARAAGRTSPNPLVGAVVVRHGVCVGEGFHPRAGEPHAEVFALNEAGEAARGATLYVTLEPCSHFGRTPPCVDLIEARGIRRVVSAMEDPDPRVAGRGHARLREAGIDVVSGVLEQEARELNAPYLKRQKTGLPYVTLKLAMSLDGKIATRKGLSKWITGEAAREEGHRLRNTHDAILVGLGTVIADDPRLTTRLPEGEPARDPIRVVLDTAARTPLSAKVLSPGSDAPTIVVVGEKADAARVEALRAQGAEVWRLPTDENGIALDALLERLGSEGVSSVLVEGGPRVHGSFVARELVDRVVAFLAPMLIGGETYLSGVAGKGAGRLTEVLRIASWRVREISPDICLDGVVHRY